MMQREKRKGLEGAIGRREKGGGKEIEGKKLYLH
jgi:hypothetical protein